MKNLTILVILIMAVSCTPDEFKPLGDKTNRVSQLEGVWKISKVIQTDNDAVSKGFPLFAQEQDVTSYFNFSDLQITLNTDKSFVVDQGTAPNIFSGLISGNWEVDNEEFPAQIILSAGNEMDTIKIGSFANIAFKQLSLKRIRYQEKSTGLSPTITYNYHLEKQN